MTKLYAINASFFGIPWTSTIAWETKEEAESVLQKAIHPATMLFGNDYRVVEVNR